jgi:4-amino-4-deoxy-L-arabinose transferase-like glycosyltransferase
MSAVAVPLRRRTRPLAALVRGNPADQRWVRPSLLAVLALAAALCLWDLTSGGYSNTYYAAAAKAGSESWKAWFFGSLDPGSFITVDKPPLSLWVIGLSARIFGYSSLSMLLPQALETIAAVGLLYLAVRRVFGPAAGIAAAAALALTPVTVAVARINNPDALLVLLLVASAYLLVRALESGRTRTLVWCAALVGLAFMTKMLQGWMLVPALGAAYLVAGPPRLAVRIRQLALAAGAMVAVSAAWPVAVSLWPASSRPYIGGSTDGSVWNLIFGYNGFGRLTGNGAGPPGGGGGATFGGAPGVLRMLNTEVGGQIAWLLPLAAVSLVAGLWLTRRAPRTDRRRAGWILFGAWAVVHVAVFSSQHGVFHPYYVSALAPAVAALAGAGVVTLWRWARGSWAAVAALVTAIAGTAAMSVALLARTSGFAPALRTLIPMAAAVAIVGAVALRTGAGRRAVAAAAVVGAFALVAGPASYSVATTGHSLFANNVLAGPSSIQRSGPAAGPPGRAGFGPPPGIGAAGPPGASTPPPGAGAPRAFAPPPGAGAPRAFAPPPGAGAPPAPRGAFPPGGRMVAPGGPGASVSAATISYLEQHQGSAKYLVAATGSQVTAPIIIKTGRPVVTIGGFNGSDPTPTVAQLAALVKHGELRYVLMSNRGGGGGPPGARASAALDQWVKAHGTVVRSGGVTLYRVSA